MSVGQAITPVLSLYHHWKITPRQSLVLMQEIQSQPSLQQPTNDVTQWMAPLVAPGMGERRQIACVGRCFVGRKGRRWRRPPTPQGHQSAVDLVKWQCRRVSLGEVQPPARGQKLGDDSRPATDVGQPDDRSPSDEGDVVLGIEQRQRIIDIPLDKMRGHAELRRQSAPAAIAADEKSKPVAIAPRRANRIVSSPKWHCK